MIVGILKGLSAACIIGGFYTIGYSLCQTLGDPQSDFFVGMIFGITSMWISMNVNNV